MKSDDQISIKKYERLKEIHLKQTRYMYDRGETNITAYYDRLDEILTYIENLRPRLIKNGGLNLVDLNGEAPTEEQAARMADYVYGQEKIKLTGGWQVSNRHMDDLSMPVQFFNGVKNACISLMNSINNLLKPTNILNF